MGETVWLIDDDVTQEAAIFKLRKPGGGFYELRVDAGLHTHAWQLRYAALQRENRAIDPLRERQTATAVVLNNARAMLAEITADNADVSQQDVEAARESVTTAFPEYIAALTAVEDAETSLQPELISLLEAALLPLNPEWTAQVLTERLRLDKLWRLLVRFRDWAVGGNPGRREGESAIQQNPVITMPTPAQSAKTKGARKSSVA